MAAVTRTTDAGPTPADQRPTGARWPWLLVAAFELSAIVGMVLRAANGEPLEDQVSFVIAFTMFVTVGAVIVSRDRRNVIGLLLLGSGFIVGCTFFAGELFTWLVASGRTGPLAVAMGLLNNLGWLFGILPALFLLPLLFPDGRPPSRRWLPLVWFVAAFLLLAAIDFVFGQPRLTGSADDLTIANPLYREAIGGLPSLDPVFAVLFPLLVLAPVISLTLRFRRESGVARQQIKWVALGFLAAAVGITLGGFIADPLLNSIVSGAAFMAFPLSIGVSVLRFHLYDLDIVVKKAVVYAAFAVFATVVYLALVVGLGTWLGRGSSFLTMLAAVVVAVTFQPVRARLNRVANRLVYGKRATPYEVLSEFSERVGDAYSDADVLPRMARVLGEGVGAERADVWLAVDRQLRDVATWPDTSDAAAPIPLPNGSVPAIPDAERAFPVEQGGELLGVLTIRKPPTDPVSPADEKLVADLAGQAGLVLRNVRLTEELRARLDDLTAAQKRLVSAQDTERRKLERNIHDGAQQQLVALAVKARLARTLTERDPAKAAEMLGQIEQETQTALEDLRDLARGIYPPLLADGGLSAAIPAQTRKAPLPVSLDVDVPRRHPQEIEGAIYFSVLEGLQNVTKYADATQAWVTVREDPSTLRFEVRDDGRGFDAGSIAGGTGLQGVADRLHALGGGVSVTSVVGAGTTLSGWIPIPDER